MSHPETSANPPSSNKCTLTRLVTVASRQIATLLGITLLLTTFSACSELPAPGYYFLPQANSILLRDDFWWSSDDCRVCDGWETGATDGASFDSFVGASYFAAVSHHQLLLSEDQLEGPVAIDFQFEIWRDNNSAFERSGAMYDYRVVLADDDSSSSELGGPSVELALFYDSDGDSAGDSDVLRVREDASLTAAFTQQTQTTGLFIERGSVSILADPLRDPPTITASVFGLDGVRVLKATREFPNGWNEPFRIALQASGGVPLGLSQLRAVDALTVQAGGQQ